MTMTPATRPFSPSALLIPLSLLVLAAATLVGAGLALMEMLQSGGGWFAGLGYALGLMALGAGDLLSFLLNVISWALRRRPSWLRALLLAQALPALLCAGWGVLQLADRWQDGREGERLAAMRAAIAHDDAATLDRLRADCSGGCRAGAAAPNALLLMAAEHGAHDVARNLVAQGARVPAGPGAPETELRTCEGLYLPGVNALGVAVAHDDAAMLNLLLAAADEDSRYRALRMAARLDRLALLRTLQAGGIAQPQRAPYDGPYDHLLSIAADGAALKVADYLLHAPPAQGAPTMPITPAVLQAALASLFQFMSNADAQPRALAFARLLAAHGADLDAPYGERASLLAQAVRAQRKDIAQTLIAAGARPQRLPRESREALETLLRGDDEPAPAPVREGCVAP